MEEFNFDARSFYKQHVKQEEEAFTRETGLSIRREFQNWRSESNNDEVFAVKTDSRKECIGLEYAGFIIYFLPKTNREAIMLLFDKELMSLMYDLYQLSDYEFKVLSEYIPSLIDGLVSATKGNFYNYCVFVSEDMVCFAKQIPFSIEKLIQDDDTIEPEQGLMEDILDLINFRLTCYEELASFNGFTSGDKRKIAFQKGVSAVKFGLKFIDVIDILTDDD